MMDKSKRQLELEAEWELVADEGFTLESIDVTGFEWPPTISDLKYPDEEDMEFMTEKEILSSKRARKRARNDPDLPYKLWDEMEQLAREAWLHGYLSAKAELAESLQEIATEYGAVIRKAKK